MKIHSQGRGPDLVLIHGWGMHAGVFEPLAESLQSDYRVHRVDLPGHGQDAGHGELGHLSDLVEKLVERLPQAIWIGWSMGGLVAAVTALKVPDRIQALVLIATTSRFLAGPDWPEGMAPEEFRQFADMLETDEQATLERFVALEVHGSDTARRDLVQLRAMLHAMPAPGGGTLRQGLHYLEHTDLRNRLAELEHSTLLIGGSHDRLVRPGAIDATAELLPNARVEILTGCGHAPFIGHPRRFTERLLAFLKEQHR